MTDERAIWARFCDDIRSAGDLLIDSGLAADAVDRAEGLRYLARLLRGGLQTYVENADPQRPHLLALPFQVKIGADNPDNLYMTAPLDGTRDYRITGRRGTVNYLGFGAYIGNYGQSNSAGGRAGYLEDSQLDIAPDGTFEIVLSRREHPGNWLRLTDDTTSLIVRQSYLDRRRETAAQLTLEALTPPTTGDVLELDRLAGRLDGAVAWARGTVERFNDWSRTFAKDPNTLGKLPESVYTAAHADPNIGFYHGYWRLAEDEALVIDVVPPACDYWNFQLNNVWMESLDYLHHRVTLNNATAESERDGSLRIVVAHRDPGHPNWIETTGHAHGTMGLRWVRADAHPRPVCRVVPVAEALR